MRLILVWNSGDGYSCSCEETRPVEYESAEKLLTDIKTLALEWLDYKEKKYAAYENLRQNFPDNPKDWGEKHQRLASVWDRSSPVITLGPADIPIESFIELDSFIPPQIFTISEWFASYGYD